MLSKVFSSRLLVSNRHECTIMGSACGREGTPRSFGYGLTVSCPVLWIAPLCRKMYLYTYPNPEKGAWPCPDIIDKKWEKYENKPLVVQIFGVSSDRCIQRVLSSDLLNDMPDPTVQHFCFFVARTKCPQNHLNFCRLLASFQFCCFLCKV